MYFITVIRLISVLFAFLGGKGLIKKGLEWAFILLGIVAAIHYNYGSDYMEYYANYEMLTAHNFSMAILTSDQFRNEIGWKFLSFVFKPIGGFFSLVAFISIVENYIYYDFVKKYVKKKWWGFAVFIYTFYSNLYLLNMSMLRQGLAIAVFIWAVNFALERKIIVSLLVSIVASFFHASAIILLPFIFIVYFDKYVVNNKLLPFFLIIFIAVLLTSSDLIQLLFLKAEQIEGFESYMDFYGGESADLNFGIAFIIRFEIFILFIIYLFHRNKIYSVGKSLVFLACIEMMIFPFSGVIRLSARLGYYFAAFLIPAFPIVMEWIPKKYKIVSLASEFLLIVLLVYGNWTFFNNPDFGFSYMNYDTIFSPLLKR